MNNIIVAIDGPAGSGKSTIAKIIAKKFNFTYIDTGAMYRMITLYLLENNIDFDDLKEIEKVLNTVNLDMQGDKFYLNNVDVTTKIREKRINENVSKVASIKIVRSNLVDLQRKISNNKDVILDGRDVGTVIFPNAQVKIFLIASPEERARRRYNEFLEKKTEITYDEVLKSIKDKDSDLTKQDFASGTAKGIDDEKVIRALVGKIAVAHASAAMTPDGQKGVSVLINLKDWEILVQSNYFLNADFKDSIEWGDNEKPTRIKGAEFLVTKNDNMVPSGTIYIVPSNTCGFATWKGTEKGVAEYHETDGARWHLQNRKYVGAICIEPKFITKFTFKATA